MNGKSLVSFDSQLLYHIKRSLNAEAKSIISENLVKARDEFGTLLHYAAYHGNHVITQYLIELGSNVDAIGEHGRTPLVLAVDNMDDNIVKILLKANADIDIADDSGESALRMVFQYLSYMNKYIFEMLVDRVRADAPTVEELLSKLIGAGCTLYHATYLKDVKVLELMLARGFDVNSRGAWQETALHAAARLQDLGLAKWLVDRGADVNALNEYGNGPLFIAAECDDKDILQFLLEQGANPNTVDLSDGETPLSIVLGFFAGSDKRCAEFVELLLQYGADISQYADGDTYTIFDYASEHNNHLVISMFICHVAVLEKLGTSVAESLIRAENRVVLNRIKKNYELCQQTLKIVAFGTSSLFDLLFKSDEQMKTYVRNETFLPKIEQFCCEQNLSESYAYFYNKLMRSISRADRRIKLENKAISVICDLFDGDYNQCYIAARKVCDYLNEADLVHLSRL